MQNWRPPDTDWKIHQKWQTNSGLCPVRAFFKDWSAIQGWLKTRERRKQSKSMPRTRINNGSKNEVTFAQFCKHEILVLEDASYRGGAIYWVNGSVHTLF